ncbi:hypothetical protein Fot_24992 [Forsythia ovata]|uniref:ATP synthase F0 subunit 8 n=1 Tax=Forsythia ovata TaxID=205694 RepID=A0ABD1U7R9_9LAMI
MIQMLFFELDGGDWGCLIFISTCVPLLTFFLLLLVFYYSSSIPVVQQKLEGFQRLKSPTVSFENLLSSTSFPSSSIKIRVQPLFVTTSFYFSRVPKFKIRSRRVVGENEDISPQPSVLCTTSVLEVAIPQASKAIVGTSTDVPLASRITMDILSVLSLEETLLRSEDIQQSGKKKTVANDKG